MSNTHYDYTKMDPKELAADLLIGYEALALLLGFGKNTIGETPKAKADRIFFANNQPRQEQTHNKRRVAPEPPIERPPDGLSKDDSPVDHSPLNHGMDSPTYNKILERLVTLSGNTLKLPTTQGGMDDLESRIGGKATIMKKVNTVGTYAGNAGMPVGFRLEKTGRYVLNPGTWVQGYDFDDASGKTFKAPYSVLPFDDIVDSIKKFAGKLSKGELKGYKQKDIYAALMNVTRTRLGQLIDKNGQVPEYYLTKEGPTPGYYGSAENTGREQTGIEFSIDELKGYLYTVTDPQTSGAATVPPQVPAPHPKGIKTQINLEKHTKTPNRNKVQSQRSQLPGYHN